MVFLYSQLKYFGIMNDSKAIYYVILRIYVATSPYNVQHVLFIQSRILFEVWSNDLNVSNLSKAEVGHKSKCNPSYKSKTHINTPVAFLCRICTKQTSNNAHLKLKMTTWNSLTSKNAREPHKNQCKSCLVISARSYRRNEVSNSKQQRQCSWRRSYWKESLSRTITIQWKLHFDF